MFVLSLLQDTVWVEPSQFGGSLERILSDALSQKFVNKVVRHVGLVVCLSDLLQIEGAAVRLTAGNARYKVVFKVVVFKPFVGEILQGTVSKSTPSGLEVDLEFFRDVKIPASNLREPRGSDESSAECAGPVSAECTDSNGSSANVVWWWEFDGHRLPYALGQPIRFRVTDVFFSKEEAHRKQNLVENEDTYTPPMVVVSYKYLEMYEALQGQATEDGLGMLAWWS